MMFDQSKIQKPEQPNAMRRQLTKGGLAVPVVLASLVSKPVLADPVLGVPWNCTISGQLSGNVSGHVTAACTSLGQSHEVLKTQYPRLGNTIITDFPALTSNYIFIDGTNLTFTNTFAEATIGQALNGATSTTELLYAQKALVLLLNARGLTDTSHYPLTEYQARNMFIAACTLGSFHDTNPDVTWNYAQVKDYIDVLYH